MQGRKRFTADEYIHGILNGSPVVLGRAITLIESSLEEDQHLASEVLNKLLPFTGKSKRIGITGVPGVGKSTFIEALGIHLVKSNKKLAVLTIDPTSRRTHGSILGDKTRMEQLSHHPSVFIRPSPSGSALGGVTNKTRESILLCEAAGYEIIFVETVGVGQSEIAVREMVDFFLLLVLAGAGDELQGIKKGIMEMADAIAITKADHENIKPSKKAQAEYKHAMKLFPPSETGWKPPVLTCSSLTHEGVDQIWDTIEQYFMYMQDKLEKLRREQNISWMYEMIEFIIKNRFYTRPGIPDKISQMKKLVSQGKITPQAAAWELVNLE